MIMSKRGKNDELQNSASFLTSYLINAHFGHTDTYGSYDFMDEFQQLVELKWTRALSRTPRRVVTRSFPVYCTFLSADAWLLEQTRLCDISVLPQSWVFPELSRVWEEMSVVAVLMRAKRGWRDQMEECDSRQRKAVLHGR